MCGGRLRSCVVAGRCIFIAAIRRFVSLAVCLSVRAAIVTTRGMMKNIHRLRGAVACSIVAILAVSATVAHAAENGEFEPFVRRYETDQNAIERFYRVPWCEECWERLERFYRESQTALESAPFDALNLHGRVDYLLLAAHIRGRLDDLALQRRRLSEMESVLPFRRTVADLALALLRMEPADPPACADRLARITDDLKSVRERIEKGKRDAQQPAATQSAESEAAQNHESDSGVTTTVPAAADAPLVVSAVTARRAAGAADALRRELREWYDYHALYQPEFTWWVRKPYEDAARAVEEYARFLREEIAGQKGRDDDPLVGDPIGREALLSNLSEEFLAYSPEELIQIGERELTWCHAQMKAVAARMGHGDDWKAALERVKNAHVGPGEQDRLVTRFGREAVDFLRERDLVTIPSLCEETWRLAMLSPESQKTLPFAAYGGQSMLVAYAAESMKHEDKRMSMRGNNRHFTRIVVPHELIPGHHLQAFMAARERPYRRLFNTPFLVEGWCLHWEMLLWDLGYAQSDEDRLGMLFWRNHRAARIIVSLQFHLGRMSPAEMVEFLLENVGMEKHGATSEVRRFIGGDYSPLYQCGYMIGGLQVRALREELVTRRGMSDREVHDTILALGPIPIELIRATLLDVPLNQNSRAAWRFDERQ